MSKKPLKLIAGPKLDERIARLMGWPVERSKWAGGLITATVPPLRAFQVFQPSMNIDDAMQVVRHLGAGGFCLQNDDGPKGGLWGCAHGGIQPCPMPKKDGTYDPIVGGFSNMFEGNEWQPTPALAACAWILVVARARQKQRAKR